MGFLRRTSGLTLLDKVKTADIRESLNIESLLLRLETSQLRWYGHARLRWYGMLLRLETSRLRWYGMVGGKCRR